MDKKGREKGQKRVTFLGCARIRVLCICNGSRGRLRQLLNTELSKKSQNFIIFKNIKVSTEIYSTSPFLVSNENQ